MASLAADAVGRPKVAAVVTGLAKAATSVVAAAVAGAASIPVIEKVRPDAEGCHFVYVCAACYPMDLSGAVANRKKTGGSCALKARPKT